MGTKTVGKEEQKAMEKLPSGDVLLVWASTCFNPQEKRKSLSTGLRSTPSLQSQFPGRSKQEAYYVSLRVSGQPRY